jgi:hypothetical protein
MRLVLGIRGLDPAAESLPAFALPARPLGILGCDSFDDMGPTDMVEVVRSEVGHGLADKLGQRRLHIAGNQFEFPTFRR